MVTGAGLQHAAAEGVPQRRHAVRDAAAGRLQRTVVSRAAWRQCRCHVRLC